MAIYTLIVETGEGRVLKIDGAVLEQSSVPVDGGILRFRAKKIIEVHKGPER